MSHSGRTIGRSINTCISRGDFHLGSSENYYDFRNEGAASTRLDDNSRADRARCSINVSVFGPREPDEVQFLLMAKVVARERRRLLRESFPSPWETDLTRSHRAAISQ